MPVGYIARNGGLSDQRNEAWTQMTPQALTFIANFGGVADQVAAGTGLSRWALLVQWAQETATGAQILNRNNLIALWQTEFDSVDPQPKLRRRTVTIVATQNTVNLFVRGTDNALYQNRFDGSVWSGWRSLGGRMSTPDIIAMRTLTGIDVFIVGQDNAAYLIASNDDGATWSPYVNLGGNLSNGQLAAIGSLTPVSGTPVDLTPVEQQLTAVGGTVNKIESALPKAGSQLQQA